MEVQPSVSGVSSGTVTPRSKLDTLPREELVRFVKKQVQNLQQAKQKCDALERKIKTLELSTDSEVEQGALKQLQSENTELKEKLKSVPALEDELLNLQNMLESANSKYEKLVHTAKSQESSSGKEQSRMKHEFQKKEKELKRAHTDNSKLKSQLEEVSSEKFKFEDMCNSLEEMTSALSKEIARLKQEKQDAIEDSDSLKHEVISLRNLQSENEQLRREVEKQNEELTFSSTRNEELMEKNAEIERLKGEVEKLRSVESSVNSWKATYGELEVELEKTRDNFQEALDERKRMEVTLASLETTLTQKAEAVLSLQEEGQILRYTLNERGRICDELKEENERLLQVLEATQSSFEQQIQDYSKEIETLRTENERLTNELMGKESELNKWIEQNFNSSQITSSDHISELENAVKTQECQLSQIELENSAVKSELSVVKEERDALQHSIEDLEEQIKSSQGELKACEVECDRLRAQNHALQADKQEKEKAIDVLEGELVCRKEEALKVGEENERSLAEEVRTLKERISELEEIEKCTGNKLKLSEERFSALSEEKCAVESVLSKTKEDLSHSFISLNELNEEFEKLKKENESIVEEWESDKKEIMKLKQFEEAATELQCLKEENAKFKCQMENWEREENALKSSLSVAGDEIVTLKKKIHKLKVELAKPEVLHKSIETEEDAELSTKEKLYQKVQEDLLKNENEVKSLKGTVADLREQLEEKQKLQVQQKNWSDQMAAQLDQKKSEVIKVKEELEKYRNQLDKYKQNASEQNVLNLEMADYQRSLTKMQEEVAQLNTMLESKTKENESLQKEMEATRVQKSKTDGTVTKYKAVLVKTKKELAETKEKVNDREKELESLTSKLRLVSEELDNMKVEMSSSVAGGQQRVQHLETALSSMQRQLNTAQNQRDNFQRELETVKQDYETYKVRVHTVLKQQQTKSEGEEEFKEERATLEKAVDELQQKLSETTVMCVTAQEELMSVQEENERLSQRFRDIQQENLEREKALKSQVDALKTEGSQQASRHTETLKQLREQNEKAKTEHHKRIDELDAEYCEKINHLQDKINSLETEISEIEVKNSFAGGENEHHPSIHQHQRRSPAFGGAAEESLSDANGDILPPFSERKPAEGSESNDLPPQAILHHSRGYYGSDDVPVKLGDLPSLGVPQTPLEDLLLSDRMSVSSFTTTSETQDMTQSRLEKAMRRIQHLNEVLNESEGTNARLTEQTKLLKEEIRRLERNSEREQHISKSEYLKNIFLKFLNPQVTDERVQLVPVLQTMLRLSPEEVGVLHNIAIGDNEAAAASSASGWTNYLHRWSGMT